MILSHNASVFWVMIKRKSCRSYKPLKISGICIVEGTIVAVRVRCFIQSAAHVWPDGLQILLYYWYGPQVMASWIWEGLYYWKKVLSILFSLWRQILLWNSSTLLQHRILSISNWLSCKLLVWLILVLRIIYVQLSKWFLNNILTTNEAEYKRFSS